eukprot:SAG31_NODE_4341_length_3339_cov_1.487346_2_plen_111_part_00
MFPASVKNVSCWNKDRLTKWYTGPSSDFHPLRVPPDEDIATHLREKVQERANQDDLGTQRGYIATGWDGGPVDKNTCESKKGPGEGCISYKGKYWLLRGDQCVTIRYVSY